MTSFIKKRRDHNIMAENYINTFAKGVELYHQYNRSDFEVTSSSQAGKEWFNYNDFYRYTAWVGLGSTAQFTENSKNYEWLKRYVDYTTRANSWDTKECK